AAIHALGAIKVRKDSVSVAASGWLSDAKAEVVDATLAMLPKLTPPPRELAAAVERMTVEKAQTHGAWRLRAQAMATLLAIDERPERHVAAASNLVSEFLATVTDKAHDKGRDTAGDDKPGVDRAGDETAGEDGTGKDKAGNDKAGKDKAGKDKAGKDAADENETEAPDDPASIWKRPEDARTLMDLVDALGELGPKAAPAVPALIELLATPGGISYVFSVETFEQHATRALARIGPPAAPALVAQLSSSDPIRRSTAAQILGRIGPAVAEVSVKPLVARLDDRAKTPRSVGCIGFDVSVRQDCLEALGKLGSASGEIAPRLIDELTRHEWNEITREFTNVARLAATRPALIDGNEPAKPELGAEPQPPLTMVEENSDAVLETLARLGANAKPAMPVLMKIVEVGELNEASAALLALARIDPRSPTTMKAAARLRARFASLAAAPVDASWSGHAESLFEAIETLAPHSPEIRDWLPTFWDAPLMSAPTRIAAAETHARLAPDDPRPVAYLRWETKRGLVIWDDTARAALERVTRSERRGQP
ncbi:MAG TPA: HEAT repeat domain-containing protein, partial [Pirellulaceae bacterium]|nr:HEAT repeat domain-containing protein [Pirellulaceae bacterium]